ncbi:farnesyl pyrophosphate synthase-like [Haemaphysalis longicornis]
MRFSIFVVMAYRSSWFRPRKLSASMGVLSALATNVFSFKNVRVNEAFPRSAVVPFIPPLRTAADIASERRRLPTVSSVSDPPVQVAREDLMKTVMEADFGEREVAPAMEGLRKALEYNLPGGKRTRLLTVVQTYELLAEDDAPYLHQACLVGWCVELMQSYILVLDDIMDKSFVRRGRPCWHTRPDVGLRAINNALFMDKAVGWVLRQQLRSMHCYPALLELFHEADFRCVLGQELDIISVMANQGQQRPSFDRYWATLDFKAGFYSLVLPIRAGMLLAGVEDSLLHEQVQAPALHLGRMYQVRDDYLDCYSTPGHPSKMGTDIVEGKYSWLLLTALSLASPEQAQRIQAHVGRGVRGGADEEAVKAVYQELDLPAHYAAYREEALRDLDAQICQLTPKLAGVLRNHRDMLIGLDSPPSCSSL